MNLSYSSRVIKYLMFVFNLIFVITGIIILAVGVSVKAYYYKYDTFLDDKYFSLPNLLIATGSIIFFISFFGCYGAIKENWLLLFIFSILLIVIFIFEFSAGIAGYVLRDKTSAYLEDRLNKTLWAYDNNEEYRNMWDIIQNEFECCGVNGPADYYPVFTNYSLPISCCPPRSGTVGAFYCNSYVPQVDTTTEPATTVPTAPPEPTTTASTTTVTTTITTTTNTVAPTDPTEQNSSTTTDDDDETTTSPDDEPEKEEETDPKFYGYYASRQLLSTDEQYSNSTSEPYTTGCENAFGKFIIKHAKEIGGCAMGLAIVQFIGIIFSCYLSRKLKNGYYST